MIAATVQRLSRARLGAWGERHIHNQLIAHGIVVTRPPHGDFQANGYVIEVKTALPGVDKQYRYCLKKKGRYGSTDVLHADVVIFLLLTMDLLIWRIYAMPSCVLADKQMIGLTGGKRSKYEIYRTTIRGFIRRLR